MNTLPAHADIVIVGAGQAGLAAAHELTRRGLLPGQDFVVLDANSGPGGAWRHRWDSLTLGKAHGIADLPGLAMKRPDPTVPSSRLVAEYYGSYEEEFGLDVIRPAEVSRVEDGADGLLQLTTEQGTITTRLLLNATGTWDSPYIPYIPGIENFQGRQLHTKHYRRKEDFAGKKTLVVGGGLSAIQFLLELEGVTETIWATRRPPNFTRRWEDDDASWGIDVEKAVRARTFAGQRPASVVRTTGIGMIEDYVEGVRRGTLVSRGMFDRITESGVIFGQPHSTSADGLGPSENSELILPESWQPFAPGTELDVDVIFWNTGFRASLGHLAPLKLRSPQGGIQMTDEVRTEKDPRVLLVGYGSNASTIGATRAGRRAGTAAFKQLTLARW